MIRSTALAFTAALALVVLAVAQDKPADPAKKDDPAPVPKGTLPVHYKALGLDDAQKKTIYKLEADYRAKIDALQSQIAALKAEEKTKTYEVLTDAQKARLKEILTKDTTPAPPVKDPTLPKDTPKDPK